MTELKRDGTCSVRSEDLRGRLYDDEAVYNTTHQIAGKLFDATEFLKENVSPDVINDMSPVDATEFHWQMGLAMEYATEALKLLRECRELSDERIRYGRYTTRWRGRQ